MDILIGIGVALAFLVPALLLVRQGYHRDVHELAAHEALEQLEHEKKEFPLDKQQRKVAVAQRVEKHLHSTGRLTPGHRKALKRLYR